MKLTREPRILGTALLVAIAAIGAGFLVAPRKPPAVLLPDPAPDPTVRRVELLAPGAHALGAASAPTHLVAFVDFQCSLCGLGSEDIRRQMRARPGRLRLTVRHAQFSLSHPHAPLMAAGAEAAALQGAYWSMHRALLAGQSRFKYASPEAARSELMRLASRLKLDRARFERDLGSPSTLARVDADLALARRVGATLAPTFFALEPGEGPPIRLSHIHHLQKWIRDPANW
ncbi:MAG TPA: thioredoxin domain-containing protein [Chthonomonadales bacterium]|nr:thioredoxin domain-containing protein [Chthonomonadales bacterium]